ncbi:hypothetical protein L2E82_13250 [Cichorium intybus]|uniref:Uncharacterized protein n=1 Tax=Cichorium intybus TaxID=13427 RepID=A0ACB9GIZ5_CICIN|nr:hypothetical protein L2E82_13250 [Cichorium intybus]
MGQMSSESTSGGMDEDRNQGRVLSLLWLIFCGEDTDSGWFSKVGVSRRRICIKRMYHTSGCSMTGKRETRDRSFQISYIQLKKETVKSPSSLAQSAKLERMIGPVTNVDPIGNSPVIIRKDLLEKIALTWMNVSLRMQDDPVTDRTFGWLCVTYAYAMASALHGVHHILRKDFMIQAMKVVKLVKLKEEFDYESLCYKLENQTDILTKEIDRQQKSKADNTLRLENNLKECQNSFKETEKTLIARCEVHFSLSEIKDVLKELNLHKDENDVFCKEVESLERRLKHFEVGFIVSKKLDSPKPVIIFVTGGPWIIGVGYGLAEMPPCRRYPLGRVELSEKVDRVRRRGRRCCRHAQGNAGSRLEPV